MGYIWFTDDTPVGRIGIRATDSAVTNLYFGNCLVNENVQITPLIDNAFIQLREYFNGERKYFHLPLKADGTAFQNVVWNAVNGIPYGHTRSYKQLSIELDRGKAVRAVGAANGKNPIPIFIPCHRVIGSDGSLTGYIGGIEVKRVLLQLEVQYARFSI